MMVDPAVVNSVGLDLDIAGVLLLFKYGLPSDVGDHSDSPPALTVTGSPATSTVGGDGVSRLVLPAGTT